LGRVTTITKGKTVLYLAAEKGHEAVVQLLVENGANINTEEEQEKLLFRTTTKGRRVLYLAAEKGYNTVVQLLVENGANVNAQEVVVEDAR
jgi:ankyrin repeat protein